MIFSDNWFTSLEWIRLLIESGNGGGGTAKVNRKGVPAEAIFPKSGPNKMDRGDMKLMRAAYPGGSYIYILAWQDSKPVHFITTV